VTRKRADAFRGVTRRELLKLSPLLGLGAFVVPSWRARLLEAGVAWSDTASGWLFRREHPTVLHHDTEVVPFDRIPYNGYDVLEPAIDLPSWDTNTRST
jgi:hypothetical protein